MALTHFLQKLQTQKVKSIHSSYVVAITKLGLTMKTLLGMGTKHVWCLTEIKVLLCMKQYIFTALYKSFKQVKHGFILHCWFRCIQHLCSILEISFETPAIQFSQRCINPQQTRRARIYSPSMISMLPTFVFYFKNISWNTSIINVTTYGLIHVAVYF